MALPTPAGRMGAMSPASQILATARSNVSGKIGAVRSEAQRMGPGSSAALLARVGVLEDSVSDIFDALGLSLSLVGEARRTRRKFGLTRQTVAGAAIAINQAVPAMKRARLYMVASQTGEITAITVGGIPVAVGTLGLESLDPTLGNDAAGFDLGDIAANETVQITGTFDVNGTYAAWLEPDASDVE